ncbi:Serpentine receptor class r-10 [Caenorhabditis elegans]|uniref:Serpentine receptor class r-10 n=1 Tax=Caenorhabditis elegans TaxID=6239 RepID=O16336_CAEEL|nr:Seven TM Receptor [Caenorhabditis elegans]CCD64057.1 Seven TM Receptor [Caenorhabditis elegans]|eukprot:NP_505087.1 Seven TM Receptor [Caenorhabditis elegans]
MAVSPYLRICQFLCFFIAIMANTVLLYLIKIRAGASFGRYRIMMITFSIYAIIYATIEILTLPVMHLHGSGILFYVNSVLKDHISAGVIISTMYCGSFAFCISMLATHFIFRYIAVCKNNKLHYFEGINVYLWLIPPFFFFTIWGSSIYINFGPNQMKKDYFRNVTLELYDEDIDKIAFIAPLYFTRGEDGSRQFNFPDLFGAFLSCNIMSICFGTCIVCAYKTYKKLNDFSIQMSKRTRALNKQLFLTLGLQTLLPCFTQYIPVGLIFILPLFEVEVGKAGNLVGVTCCLYPAMDPLIAIFMIDRFRNFIFRKESPSTTKSSKISAINSEGFSSTGK